MTAKFTYKSKPVVITFDGVSNQMIVKIEDQYCKAVDAPNGADLGIMSEFKSAVARFVNGLEVENIVFNK